MKNLDKLIERLKEAKEELNKNVNMSYASGTPNGAMKNEGVTSRPESESGSHGGRFSDKKDVGNGRMVAGDSPSPAAVNSKLMSDIAAKADDDVPPARDLKHKTPDFKLPNDGDKMRKGDEYFRLFKNGQWEIKKDESKRAKNETMPMAHKPAGSKDMADPEHEKGMKKASMDPKLEPKDKKVKALQQQVDAGTYKPDSKKIAGAMLKEEKHLDPEEHDKKIHDLMSHGLKTKK